MRRTLYLIVGILLLSPQLMFAAAPQCPVLVRNLRLGDRGDDVFRLQQALNVNSFTQIANLGVGSPGNETSFFGVRTAAAVKRFQELYRAEILTPSGQTVGTGYVGLFTRAKILTLCAPLQSQGLGAPVGVATTTPVAVNKLPVAGISTTTTAMTPTSGTLIKTVPTTKKGTFVVTATNNTTNNPNNKIATSSVISDPFFGSEQLASLQVRYASNNSPLVGVETTLYGTGFELTGNTLHLGAGYQLDNLGVDKYGLIHFIIPYDAPRGKVNIWVSNSRGVSNTDASIIIIDNKKTIPVIKTVTPDSGSAAAQVTITGTGFSTSTNKVMTSMGEISGIVSSDGTTLTVTLPVNGLRNAQDLLNSSSGHTLPIYVFVSNDKGLSNGVKYTVNY